MMLKFNTESSWKLITLLIMLFSQTAIAEQIEKPRFGPNSEIYLFDLEVNKGVYSVKNGRNITNNPDYDSQPYFTPSGHSILFSSARDAKQTDIFEYHIKSGKISQITNTEHSEFSPKPVGNTGNVSFVSEGFTPYQTVRYLDKKTGEHRWLLNSKEPVGYYQYNDATGDVLFWSRYGWSVQYLNVKRNQNRFVSGHAVPSTPQKIPNSHRFSFVHRQTNGMMWIKAFDPEAFSITHIAPIFDANHDYAWAPNGDILRFDGTKLSIWPAGNKGYNWTAGQELSSLVKGKLGRLAISDDGKYLALVTTL